MATQTLPAETRPRFKPKGEFWTDEEIMALPDDQGQRYELRNGEIIVMSPATPQHEEISLRLAAAMLIFAEEHRLGFVYGGNAGFRLSPLTCYAPDVSFVSKERLRLIRYNPEKFFKDAPDLAVEVVSPNDSIRQTAKKIGDYFQHGTRLAWMILPRRRQVRVYRSPTDFTVLEDDAKLDGEDILPGFQISLQRLFLAPSFD